MAMSFLLNNSSQTHAATSPPFPNSPSQQDDQKDMTSSLQIITIQPLDHSQEQSDHIINSSSAPRAQWLRAAVLGATDGIVSVASIMIGVGAVNSTTKAMIVSGLAGLVAGACSMAIGELVSVYTQYDVELAQILEERSKKKQGSGTGGEETAGDHDDEEKGNLPSPPMAALASFVAFVLGAVLPLLAGGFIHGWWVRVVVVGAVSGLALVGFGAASAVLGNAPVVKSTLRLLVGGWMAMLFTYGVVKAFGVAFGLKELYN